MTRTEQVKPASETEELAEAIRKISDAVMRLQRSGLNRRAIVALIKDHSGVGKGHIEQVLNSLATLEKFYTVPK
jgi:hypothetical protein